MKLRSALLLLSLALAGCAAHAQGVPDVSKAALDARPIPWKTGSLQMVPEAIRHLQVVITPGFARGQHFAWFVNGGRDLVIVFSGTSSDVDEIGNELANRYFPEEGLPGDRRGYVILGVLKGPGPGGPGPDPGPSGFPDWYVRMIMRASVDANLAQIHIDEVQVPGTAEKTQ